MSEMRNKLKGLIRNKIQEWMCMHMFTDSPTAVRHAADFIVNGDIVAVPTDTVYGLCCSANNEEAVQKLFNIKGRTLNKPISLCFSTIRTIDKWADISYIPHSLISDLLPGPVTLVLRAKTNLHKLISTKSNVSGMRVVGVRIPENKFIQAVCAELADPLALTSANVSGKSDSVSVEEFRDLWPYIACVYDEGSLPYRAASTVIDLSKPNEYKILREGAGLDLVQKKLNEYNFDMIMS